MEKGQLKEMNTKLGAACNRCLSPSATWAAEWRRFSSRRKGFIMQFYTTRTCGAQLHDESFSYWVGLGLSAVAACFPQLTGQ
eukprot:scaffold169690_cov18-Tisochrysis_lutea.AAC.1